MKKGLILSVIIFLVFSSSPVIAKADDLIIEDNGSVSLIITDNSVLAAETAAPSTPVPSKTEAPKPPTAPAAAPKVIPVAPANSSTTVKISPNTTNDKKLNITIETKTKAAETPIAAPVIKPSGKATATNPTTPPGGGGSTQSTQKTVDNVILRNAAKEPVLTIQADQNQSNQVNIQEKDVKVSTNLPLQIDSKSHVVSVDTENGSQKVSVLPDQAVKGAEEKLTRSSLKTSSSIVTLVQERGQAEYVVNQTKNGKFLGVVNITLPSQVKISAQTGKTISVWQSPLSYLSGFLIR